VESREPVSRRLGLDPAADLGRKGVSQAGDVGTKGWGGCVGTVRVGPEILGEVNTAVRVMSAGHGGQNLLTPAARVAMSSTSDGLTFRSLGAQKLKDLPEPIELLQVGAEGLAEAFPPLRIATVR
ncbi:MAG: hypothetical protein WEB55_03260, partial [Acidimicrobiia bacterium]